MTAPATSYLLERAWVDGAVHDDVLVEVADGRFRSVTLLSGADAPAQANGSTRLPGLTLPGAANTHSHAFHRALRGRGGGTGRRREQVYDVAARLDPDSCYPLARATYAEMLAAGYTGVGEFHYLHHQLDGRPYADPNAMGHALIAAARDAGIRITLLDALYLSAGFGAPPQGVQCRFADGSAETWQERVAALVTELSGEPDVRLGVAAHSVRAVPADALEELQPFLVNGIPLHVHLSASPRENEECRAVYGLSPTELLAEHDLLGATTTAVHATHLDAEDIALLGATRTGIALCPTTEHDLGEAIGPARALSEAGATLTLGSGSHAVIDPFAQMRALERAARPAELLAAATAHGHAALGVPDAGALTVGERADLVTLALDSPRTVRTGRDEQAAVLAAAAADVTHVVVDGRVVFDGDHTAVEHDAAAAVDALWR
ncbi:formimidoylglutamate deiminase [Nocardioides sp. zg-536]|uniref:Formimidoylglutamate deiminase n=1 Tax=Nocardioides faecalis TaxID=2803858 RepID=A0A938Y0T3_9ACTN|nr:formimidoylglutamate deiminase [Nocardioides faecalis]MBM9460067.1 formimidoylglutamate deiminase [Nocardioides faecalis]QVI60133.1 formimidoylglutamate deiminase [Nocardioides faecalis]